MSRIYDDLKGDGGGRGRRRPPKQVDIESLDLFAHAAAKREAAGIKPTAFEDPPGVTPEEQEALMPLFPSETQSLTHNEPPPPEQPYVQEQPVEDPAAEEEQQPVEEQEVLWRTSPISSAPLAPFTDVRPRPARVKKGVIVGAGIALFLAILFAIFTAKSKDAPAPGTAELTDGKSEELAATDSAAMPEPRPIAPNPQLPETSSFSTAQGPTIEDVNLDVRGATVTTEGGQKSVVFEAGVFRAGYRVDDNARAMLLEVAAQLKPFADDIVVTVIGCTDNVPVTRKREYKDNRELGMLRARAVAEIVRQAAGLPEQSISTVSYGAEWAPHPNDTPANRARNRTVVLKISMR